MRCFKILELHNKREKNSGKRAREKNAAATADLCPLWDTKSEFTLIGFSSLARRCWICCLEKLLPYPTSRLIFPDSLLSFLLSPFGGRGIVPEISVKKYVAATLTDWPGPGPSAAAAMTWFYDADVRRQAGGTTPPTCARDRRNLDRNYKRLL